MANNTNNPYSAPQTIPRQESSILKRCLKRGGVGALVAIIIFQIMVQFSWHLEVGDERYRGMMHCSYCVLVAVTSVFTQSDNARAKGRTGIISACLIFFVALIAGVFLTRLLGIIPYPLYRSIPFTLEMSAKEVSIVWAIDVLFVFLFVFVRPSPQWPTPNP